MLKLKAKVRISYYRGGLCEHKPGDVFEMEESDIARLGLHSGDFEVIDPPAAVKQVEPAPDDMPLKKSKRK